KIGRLRQGGDVAMAGQLADAVMFRIDGPDRAGKAAADNIVEHYPAHRALPRRCPDHGDGAWTGSKFEVPDRQVAPPAGMARRISSRSGAAARWIIAARR